MPKHQGPIQKLIDPFSVPAQMNNLGVLVVAYVTMQMREQTKCVDPQNESFLNFIYYGSTIVCATTFLLSIFYMLGLIDFCINKIMPCGQVCLTINTLTIFIMGTLYHFIATLYGLYVIYFETRSACIELEMFKQITCTIYALWFFCIICYVIFKYCYLSRRKKLATVTEEEYSAF